MKEKSDWITKGINVSFKHNRSLYTFTKNSNDPKAKAHYIKYTTIIRKFIKEGNINRAEDLQHSLITK
jgi:pentatricopeptide repeat protein